MAKPGEIRTGTAGWVFEPWRGPFYPKGVTQKQELAYASGQLRVIEINSTFYSNQRLSSFANWADQTAAGFTFTVKGPKFITHQLKLRNAAGPLANFMATGVLRLGEKLGPFIWQLPGNLHYDRDRIASFLDLLPHTPADAAALAGKHDAHLKDAPFTETAGIKTVRHAIEVRHESYANAEFVDLLRAHNVGLVIGDTADWPYRDLTADFAYLRLQGPADPASDAYSEADLDSWAATFKNWSEGKTATGGQYIVPPKPDTVERDVFCFFVHENKIDAPKNARAIMQRLGIKGPGGT